MHGGLPDLLEQHLRRNNDTVPCDTPTRQWITSQSGRTNIVSFGTPAAGRRVPLRMFLCHICNLAASFTGVLIPIYSRSRTVISSPSAGAAFNENQWLPKKQGTRGNHGPLPACGMEVSLNAAHSGTLSMRGLNGGIWTPCTEFSCSAEDLRLTP